MKITNITEAKNIEIYGDGYFKSFDGWKGKFFLKIDRMFTGDVDKMSFILDENYKNDFEFSIYKDYQEDGTYYSYVIIEGDNGQSFAIKGYEINV